MTQRSPRHERETYEDFTGGEFGVTHSRQAGKNQFTGKNVVVYRDGTLGPRNGLIEQPLAGASYVNGILKAFFFGVENEVATPRMIFVQGTRPRFFEVNDMTAQTPGVFGPTPPFDFAAEPDGGYYGILPRLGFQTFFASLGDATYLLNNLTDEITSVDPTGAHDLVEYLDQVYQIGLTSAADGSGHIVNYSGHADPTTWPVENTFAVGYAWVVFRGMQMMNGLLICGQDETWWLLQGTPEEGSLRRVAHGRGPAIGNPRSVVVDREVAWFLATGSPGGSFPGVFDGSELDTDSLKHLRGWMTDANAAAVLCEADDDLMFVDNDARALMRHEGVWTRHEYEVAVGEWAAPYEDQRFYLAVDGSVSTKPTFFRSTFATEGPAVYDGEWASPGDGSLAPVDAYVEFPELYQPDDSLHRPMAVTVEFTSYDTSGTAEGAELDDWLPAHLEVEVDILNRFGQESIQTVSAGTWDEADAAVASTSEGVRHRHVFEALPATAPGSGLRVRLIDIRGIKIERVTLDYELSPAVERR